MSTQPTRIAPRYGESASSPRIQSTGFPYDLALWDMAGRESAALAASAAHALEYPMPELRAAGGVPLGLLVRPIGLGLLSVFAVFGFARGRRSS